MFLHSPRSRGRRGFYLLGLLIVLAIIAILYGKQLLPDKDGPGAISYIGRSKGAACSVNRATMATTIAAWGVSHPNQPPTIEALRQSGNSTANCPDGGVYEIGSDNVLYCSKHYPRPQGIGLAGASASPGTQPAGDVQAVPGPGAGMGRQIVTPPPTPEVPAE